jgi:hypothetical protein
MNLEIAGYCVYLENDKIDPSLFGDRRARHVGNTHVVYCENIEDAQELQNKVKGSSYGPYYHLRNNSGIPDENGTVLY